MKGITNRVLAISLFFITSTTFGQVSGDLKRDNRKVTKNIKYTVSYSKPGKMIFSIVVDRNGNVITCLIDEHKSTIRQGPIMLKSRDMIKNGLKFEAGNYPPNHHGYVEINTTQ
ncbi:hypothetical protein K6119_06830 [Paracrocinitomix mangrovi]|uniref:hypothetical protein n=1 Tax=Paracrocinitomix mangrovi TaxID=2862509 RepID=UPI001C8D9DEB|nr:hypothetical protein [Paracrocinitomix mangrovi]UKN03228.1 hypothetical protein K6119_06830 [Paracrocinitomix mangrovi]